jgi:predicted AAA+ superfamily ATPase
MFIMPSKRFTLNYDDTRKWLKNAAIFLAPALLFFLIQIQAGKPWQEALDALYLWGINTAIDILRKFVAGK